MKMLEVLKRSKGAGSSPPTDRLPSKLIQAKERYLEAKDNLAELQVRKSALEEKVRQIGERLDAVPATREALEGARRVAIAGEVLDPTKVSRLNELDGQLEQLAREESNLRERRGIYRLNGNAPSTSRGSCS